MNEEQLKVFKEVVKIIKDLSDRISEQGLIMLDFYNESIIEIKEYIENFLLEEPEGILYKNIYSNEFEFIPCDDFKETEDIKLVYKKEKGSLICKRGCSCESCKKIIDGITSQLFVINE